MSEYAVITENDESPWEDVKGEIYHFPTMYKLILTPGCKVIYYTGRMKDKRFAASRLSIEPHYFGKAEIGRVIDDPLSKKGDWFCEIINYNGFIEPVPIKKDGDYLEVIPESRQNNYWRFAVREISKTTYEHIINMTETLPLVNKTPRLPTLTGEFESLRTEGGKTQRYTTYYERDPWNRKKALEIHGLNCMACNFNFAHKYGKSGDGYIHVHHIKPVSEIGKAVKIEPAIDLVVLCANCHAIVHRHKDHTLSMDELKNQIK